MKAPTQLKPLRTVCLFAAFLAWVEFVSVSLGGAVKAQTRELFTPVPEQEARSLSNPRIAKLRSEPTTKSLQIVKVNSLALQGNDTRVLYSGRSLSLSKQPAENEKGKGVVWHGRFLDIPGSATLVVRDGNITGTIEEGNELIEVQPLGDGMHAIVEVDVSKFPPDEPPGSHIGGQERRGMLIPQGDSADRHKAPVDINVLVGYTASASSAVYDINSLIVLAAEAANQSYRNSKVNIVLNLVGSFEYADDDTGKSQGDILNAFSGDEEVIARRNNSRADLVALIVNESSACGLAKAIMADESNGFAVVHYNCAVGNYSFAHELGHLMGAHHDPAHDPDTWPFPHGHGLEHPASNASKTFRTIMAYPCDEGSCNPRIPYWSNPQVKYNGTPTGWPDCCNNAAVLNATAPFVATFRNRSIASTGDAKRAKK